MGQMNFTRASRARGKRRPPRSLTAIGALSLAALALLCGPAVAATAYPSKPIHYIVASAPGGIADTTARVLGPRLADVFHQPVVIENKGGSIVVGAEAVARAQPNGYMLLSATPKIAIVPSMVSDLPFNPRKDLAPVALIGIIPNVLMVGPRTPARSLKELVDIARARPGELNFSSTGAGTSVHLTGELLNYYAKVHIVHVPYHGAAAAMVALIAGEVDMMVDALPPSLPHIRAGKVRALAVTSAERVPQLPDVPTMAELGYPELEINGWTGVMTTGRTPPEVIARLESEIKRILADPEVARIYDRAGMSVHFLGARDFGAFLDKEIEKFALAVKSSGAREN